MSQHDEALHERREWLLATLAGMGDGVLTTDTKGCVTFLNPVAQSLTGWTLDEALGVPLGRVLRIVQEESQRAVEDPATRALREGRAVVLADHTLLLAKDGTGRAIDVSAAPICDAQSDTAGVVLVFRDVTERRRHERRLRDALAFAENLLATLREPFLVLDTSLRIKFANAAFYRAFRAAKAETENRFLYEWGQGRWNLPGLRAWLEGVLSKEDPVPDFEVEPTAPAPERRILRLHARRFGSPGGRPDLILLSLEDLTERRQAEALADLHRRQDAFLAMLSHELRNPLAPIVNAVHLLGLQKDANPIQQQARTILERQVGQLAHLVNDLLEISRITTGRIRLHQENVDLRGIVERAVESARPLVDQRRHELTVAQPPDPIWLHADPTRIEQVLVNLLNNAAKYTAEGGRIWLSVHRESDYVVLRVRDTGVGIAPDLLPRIFDLFTQAEQSREHSQGGLGIGLTLVQKLVEMHRGTVKASSAPGQGSEFVVRLPVFPAPARPPQPTSSEAGKPPAPSLRVLVVDDNVDQADSAALLLEKSGHQARVAYSGPIALQAAVEYQPDLVLLDIGLPEMDGYEVARRLRQHPELQAVSLIALTGYGQETDRHRSRAAGFDHHLVKPVDLQKLQEVLAALANQRAGRSSPP